MLANYSRAVGRKSCTKPTKPAAHTSTLEQRMTDFVNGISPLPRGNDFLELLREMHEATKGMALNDDKAVLWLRAFRLMDDQQQGWMGDLLNAVTPEQPPADWQPAQQPSKPAEPTDAPPLSFARLSPAQQREIRVIADLDSRNVEGGKYDGATVTTRSLLHDGGWLWYGGQPLMPRLTDAAWDALERHDTGQPEPVGTVGLRDSDSPRALMGKAAKAAPVDLLPEFHQLTFAEQVRVRAALWLELSGPVGERVAWWLYDALYDEPDTDAATLETRWREWMHPPIGQPRPFDNFGDKYAAQGGAWRGFRYAIGDKKPHARRKLTPAERDACLTAMLDIISSPATDD